MKIISLKSENIKRLVAVEITPTGNLVEITGANGAGKTSVLDSIWWALGGTKPHQSRPIRDGETEAKIRLDLGEVVVRREFKQRKEGRVTTSLVVENADGSRFPSPQSMIDQLLDSLSFDPLAFARMTAKGQYDVLRSFVSGVDFEAEATAHKSDYERRRDHNRNAAAARARSTGIVVPDAPDLIDLDALNGRMAAAERDNDRIRETQRAYQQQAYELEGSKQNLVSAEDEVSRLSGMLAEAQKERDEIKVGHERKAATLAETPEPEPTADIAPLREEIMDASRSNRLAHDAIARAERKAECESEAKGEEAASADLTTRIDDRKTRIANAIESADMPVDGLGLADEMVLLDDLPFEQASDSKQLLTSLAIAAKLAGKLRVGRIRHGNDLDDERMGFLRQWADDNDFQVWIERVDTSGKVGIVIEDGRVKGDSQ